jgi:hypothetical protein
VRTATDSGVGLKTGDRYAVPLSTACHAKQHRIGELSFWSALRIDPLNVALRLWTVSADVDAGERTVFARDSGSIWQRRNGLGCTIPGLARVWNQIY